MLVKRPLVINQPEIGKLVRELRVEVGLTQEQFAVELGELLLCERGQELLEKYYPSKQNS